MCLELNDFLRLSSTYRYDQHVGTIRYVDSKMGRATMMAAIGRGALARKFQPKSCLKAKDRPRGCVVSSTGRHGRRLGVQDVFEVVEDVVGDHGSIVRASACLKLSVYPSHFIIFVSTRHSSPGASCLFFSCPRLLSIPFRLSDNLTFEKQL